MSPTVTDLAAALAKAQGEMGGAVKDSANPFFKSKYADLASVMEACRAPLAKHGLSVVQSPSADGARVSVETILLHTSGQWIRGTATAAAKDDGPQSIGSAITYLRRYALQSFAGVAPEDDDGEAATHRNGNASVSRPVKAAPVGYDEWVTGLTACADDGQEALRTSWEASPKPLREHITATAPTTWTLLKAKAQAADAKKAKAVKGAA